MDFFSPQPKRKRIDLKGKAKAEFRMAVFRRAGGRCEVCGEPAPLKDYDGNFDVFGCGHVCHFTSKGAGGDDVMENVYWGCYECHIRKEHGPRWQEERERNAAESK